MARAASRNPYLAGTQAVENAAAAFSNDRYLKIANNAKNWRLGFFGLLLLSGGLAGGLVMVSNRQQVVPYVVEVDEAGSARMITEVRATAVHDPVVIQAVLRKWLQDIRTLSSDHDANQRRTQDAYGMALEPAQKVIAAYYQDSAPEQLLARGRTFPVKITLHAVSATTWRARWHEQLLEENGRVQEETAWEATIEIVLVLPKTTNERLRSPLGLWIANLQWNPV
jgi:type IV secretion system protein VirB5